MIKLDTINKIEKYEGSVRHIKASLTSDTAAEVKAIGTSAAEVDGLLNTDVLAAHSTCFTAEQELLVLGSDGNWKEG